VNQLGALALLTLTACALLPGTAAAHLLPPQNATIHAVGDKVYTVVSVPISALSAVDDDGDGQLSVTELRRHQTDISQQFMRRFQLSMPKETGRPLTSWVLSPQTGGGAILPMRYVVVLEVLQFSKPVDDLTLRTDLFGNGAGAGRGAGSRAHPDRPRSSAVPLDDSDRRGGMALLAQHHHELHGLA
jgi:hypothetical protein